MGAVLARLGSDTGDPLALSGVLVVGMIGVGASHGLLMSRWHRTWTEAGFESPNPPTMSAREARDKIEDPGAVSGRKVRVERA